MKYLIALLIAAGMFCVSQGMRPKAKPPVLSASRQVQFQEQREVVNYERKIAVARYTSSMAAVATTCLESYHRDSCLHHLIRCGAGCKAIIPKQKLALIETDYWKLMRQRGLK